MAVPNNIAIANKLRSCALVLKYGGDPAGPIEVIDAVVAELDAWEAHLEKRRKEPKPMGGSKREVRRRGR
jgi:hypothetical protein